MCLILSVHALLPLLNGGLSYSAGGADDHNNGATDDANDASCTLLSFRDLKQQQ